MAHKTVERRSKMQELRNAKGSCDDAQQKQYEELEITQRFVGVDETDHAANHTVHVLKTRCYSEQNLIMKSSLKRGTNPTTLSNQKTDCDKLNNNSPNNECLNQNVTRLESKSFAKSVDCIKDLKDNPEDAKREQFKKNSNVYSVSHAKTILKERRRSLPTLPKLIGQKLQEHKAERSDVVAALTKDFRDRTFRTLSKGLGRLLKRHSSVNISEPDPVFKVAYLGNVLTGWAKGEGCVDKPLSTLWRNYNQSSKPDVVMKLSITNSGLKGVTKEHGLTEYWAHRITFCTSPPEFPKIFCWVYRHEGRKLKHEMRCHAVLCPKESIAKRITTELQCKIHQALLEFKRDKIARQNARLSLANCVYENPSMPRRKILLSVGGNNYKPPLERSKSAPKLMAIEEMCSEEDEEETISENNKNTWTKDSTAVKMCCKVDDIFPSYTLGRRKCEHIKNIRKISLPESKMKPETIDTTVTCKSTNHVSFDFSNISESSDAELNLKDLHIEEEEDNDVFYCETEEDKAKIIEPTIEKSRLQPNFVLLDSDEGSISSGCETASTVTSSDTEMSSLPCSITQSDYNENSEKISVLERVQSFEQLFIRERDSLRSNRSSIKSDSSKKMRPSYCNQDSIISTGSSSPSDSACYTSSTDTGPSSCSDEVNLVPLGEKCQQRPRTAYMRCSTFPPDSELMDHEERDGEDLAEDAKLDFKLNYIDEVEQTGDSDSACSVESGYSELLESLNQGECMIGNTVMV